MPCVDAEGWDVGMGGNEVQEGGDICIHRELDTEEHMADSLSCTA